MRVLHGSECFGLELPDPEDEVMPGVPWGRFDHLFTPAFWFSRAWYKRLEASMTFRLGETVAEEIVACLLGGYGLPAEIGLAAFTKLRDRGLIVHSPDSEERIRAALIEPLMFRGRIVHYRYPNQRARFIAKALYRLDLERAPLHSDLTFRAWLATFDGIGLKTASWITRNVLQSDNVAILDIHVFRAGVLAGLFASDHNVMKHYFFLESRLVEFAIALGVRLSLLDALIWHHMRLFGRLAIANTRHATLALAVPVEIC